MAEAEGVTGVVVVIVTKAVVEATAVIITVVVRPPLPFFERYL
jgi:hypothetical protein